jgi:hypothetical protein
MIRAANAEALMAAVRGEVNRSIPTWPFIGSGQSSKR